MAYGESDQFMVLGRRQRRSAGERTDEMTQPVKETRTGQEGPGKSVQTSLQGIADKARKERSHRFQNLFGMLNVPFIEACWSRMNKKSAAGVDHVSAREYEQNLRVHIEGLVERLKGNRYRAKLVRRQYIPKEPGKMRPLGIPATEDKLLQKAVAVILEAIYEQEFLPCSFGYRPKVGAKTAVENLSQELATGKYTAIVEADIKAAAYTQKPLFISEDNRKSTRLNSSHANISY